MRTFLVILVAAGLGGVFYYQRHSGTEASASNSGGPKPVTTHVVQTTTTKTEPSEHNWMKRSLDRATEVRDQARARTQQSQDP